MQISHEVEVVEDINVLVLVVGLALLVAVVIFTYREIRQHQLRKLEASAKLMIGTFDLYKPNDRARIVNLIINLYRLYLDSHTECGVPLRDNLSTFERFITDFAHPYLNGRYHFTGMSDQVITVFRNKHIQFFNPDQSA